MYTNIKLDCVLKNQTIASVCHSYAHASAQRKPKLYQVLNLAHGRLRGMRRNAVALLARAASDRRSAIVTAINVINGDIRMIDRALNAQ